MRIAITGHTGNIGGYLYSHLPAHKGFSRSTGYDIKIPEVQQVIIDESTDCDVFINCAHGGPGNTQTDLLLKIYESWKDQNKHIINIGSDRADPNVWSTVREDYPLEKSILATTVDHLQKQKKASCKVSIINPNIVNENMLPDILQAVKFIIQSNSQITSINLQ